MVSAIFSQWILFLASGQNVPKGLAIAKALRVFDLTVRRLSDFDIGKRLRGEKAVGGFPSRDRKRGKVINATFYSFQIGKFHLIAI